jgi:type I restriction enzyme S subunit
VTSIARRSWKNEFELPWPALVNESRWLLKTLADVVSLQRGHDLPVANRRSGSVPVIGSAGPTGYHNAAIKPGPGVTVGRSGSLGVATWVPEDYWPLNTVLYATDFHGNDPRFVYYLLRSLDFRGFNSGSVQPSLNRNFIAEIAVRVPPKDEQAAVGAVLGALDDKIDHNQHMREELFDLASAMFYAAFSSATNVQVPLRSAADLIYGRALHAKDRQPGDIPVLGSSGPIGTHNESLADGPGIVIGRKGNPGVVTWVDEPFWPIDTTFFVRPHDGWTLPYLFFELRRVDLQRFAADSAVPGLNRDIALSTSIRLASESAQREFANGVRPNLALRAALRKESETLGRLRDTLLPELISGRMTVN